MAVTFAMSPSMCEELSSSCQEMMSGTVSVATAFSRKLCKPLMLSE